MAIAWPYAAVYTDPAFAASLLQAAASTLPLHYPPPPPVYPSHYPPRYHPWGQGFGIPQASLHMANPAALNLNQNITLNTNMPPTLPPTQLPQGLNINLGLDFQNYPKFEHQRISPTASPVNSDISLSPAPGDGLLMTSNVSPTTTSTSQTQLNEKPKLFKPYKSEV